MTAAAAMIGRIRALGASLSSDGARLIIDGAPPGAITPELRDQILQLKPAMLLELNGAQTKCAAVPPPSAPIGKVANLLAAAYRRCQAKGVVHQGDSDDPRLANAAAKSVHGGDQ